MPKPVLCSQIVCKSCTCRIELLSKKEEIIEGLKEDLRGKCSCLRMCVIALADGDCALIHKIDLSSRVFAIAANIK